MTRLWPQIIPRMRQTCLLLATASLSTALQAGQAVPRAPACHARPAVIHAPACRARPVVMQVAHTDDPLAKEAWLSRRHLPLGMASSAEMAGCVMPTDAASSAYRRAAEVSAWLDDQQDLSQWDPPTDAQAQPQASAKELLRTVKDAGIAGVVSFALVQTAFWAASVPVCVVAYSLFTGHVPDLQDQEDMAQFGAEAFAWVNVARFAAPLRVGTALSAVPWVQANIVDRLSRADHRSTAD